MRERRKNKFLPDLFFSKFFLIACVALFLAILFGLAQGTIKNYRVDSEITDLQKEIANLGRQNQEFSQLIDYFKSDSFIEQEAKLKMGLKKPGENLVVIPQAGDVSKSRENAETENLSNPMKWWLYFFKS
ncbi:MAG: septum formation initiator family protein [Patescibacteria group bacterium]